MDQVRDITECCVCTEVYTDPKILSCMHTFCLKCLKETALQEESKPGDTMSCPVCRKPFVVPAEGMAGLQKNFFMQKLVEISKLSAPQSSAIFCDICQLDTEEEAKEISLAVQYCIQCHQNICDRCCQYHKRFTDLQNHQLVQIGSPLKDELTKNLSYQFCDLHAKEEAKLYCNDCKEIACIMCFVQKHRSHNCSASEEVAEELRDKIKCCAERMTVCAEEATAKMCEIDAIQNIFQARVEDVKKEITQRGRELEELIVKYTKSLLHELALISQRVSTENKTKRERSETHKLIIQSFETYCMELSKKGSCVEICRATNDMQLRADELDTAHQKLTVEEILSIRVKFEKSKMEDFLKKEIIIGNIRVTFCPTIHLIDKLDLQSFSDICGVTKLENTIYVLSRRPKSILVLNDEAPFKLKANIKIFQIYEPLTLASCEKSKCLYANDQVNTCIWKIAADDYQVTKWLTKVDNIQPTLSVTGEGHLLVLTKGNPSSLLEIYGSDAKLIRRLSLPSDIRHPEHIIQKKNGEFIVSHTPGRFYIGRVSVISRVTNDGQTVTSSINTNDIGLSPEQMGLSSLALDSENDRIFVSCYGNSVLVFDSISLDLIKVLPLAEVDRSSSCRRLFYDVKKKQLIVVHCIGKVEIYDIKDNT